MKFFVGTSGYSYDEWKGTFYPAKLPKKDMLSLYAQSFATVEINNTFYRMPSSHVIESWASKVPDNFRFVIKAPKAITHEKRFSGTEQLTDELLSTVSILGQQQGPLLFQLPPYFKKDLSRLEAFVSFLGGRAPSAFEFRHESWFDDDVFDCLRANACALCIAETDNAIDTQLVGTTDWGYLRLRREGYPDQELLAWIEKLRSQPWREAYVFFKHEDAGVGPKLATRFLELAGS